MNTKIALLEPSSGVEGCYTHAGHNEFEPIGLECLASALLDAGYDVRILRQGLLSVENAVDILKSYGPQVLGLTVMTHAANAAIAISKLAKQQIPNLNVVAGGYHPSGYSDFILEPSVDYVVVGEGEKTIIKLLECIKNKGDLRAVNGIRFKEDGKVVSTEPAMRITDLEDIPLAYRSHNLLSANKMHTLMLPAPSKQNNLAVVMSSRGCPHGCSFCCSRSIWGRQVVFRKPGSVVEEIKQLVNNYGTNALFFSDLTFNCNESYVLDLCDKLIQFGNTPPWYAMCTITNLNSKLVSAMHRAGCRKIGFGIEALSESHLQKLNKNSITTLDKINYVLEMCDNVGLLTKGYLIIGYPWETRESLDEFNEALPKVQVDEIRISYFTPFPGSVDYDQYKNKLSTSDWSKFNAIRNAVIINDNDLSDNDLKMARVNGFKRFYNNPDYRERITQKISRFPEFRESYNEFFNFLERGGVFQNTKGLC
jgi:radical SAM superfamily enzyme YgiQ (UPF0313 family)